MSAREITRRDALRAGGMALAAAAGSTLLGGCAAPAASGSAASSAAGSVSGDRSGVPEDATGNQTTSAASIAKVDDVQI